MVATLAIPPTLPFSSGAISYTSFNCTKRISILPSSLPACRRLGELQEDIHRKGVRRSKFRIFFKLKFYATIYTTISGLTIKLSVFFLGSYSVRVYFNKIFFQGKWGYVNLFFPVVFSLYLFQHPTHSYVPVLVRLAFYHIDS